MCTHPVPCAAAVRRSAAVKEVVGMFIACGTILSIKDVADDRALETLLHGAPTKGNAVYEDDIERCVPVCACRRAWKRLCRSAARSPVGWSAQVLSW